jgi:hypothetical protein
VTDEINKDRDIANKDMEIAKALGMCNESCIWCSIDCKYDFSDRDRLLLLEKMREREDWGEFKYYKCCKISDDLGGFIDNFLLNKGALRDAVWEWLKER